MARHFASVDGDGVGNCVTRGDSRDGLVSGKIIHHCQTYLFVFIGCRWCRFGRGRGRRRCVVTTGPRRTATRSGCRARGGGEGQLEKLDLVR